MSLGTTDAKINSESQCSYGDHCLTYHQEFIIRRREYQRYSCLRKILNVTIQLYFDAFTYYMFANTMGCTKKSTFFGWGYQKSGGTKSPCTTS